MSLSDARLSSWLERLMSAFVLFVGNLVLHLLFPVVLVLVNGFFVPSAGNWAIVPLALSFAIPTIALNSLLVYWDAGLPELEERELDGSIEWNRRLLTKPLVLCAAWTGLVFLLAKCGALTLSPDNTWGFHLPGSLTRTLPILTAAFILYGWVCVFVFYWAVWGRGKAAWFCSRINVKINPCLVFGSELFYIVPVVLPNALAVGASLTSFTNLSPIYAVVAGLCGVAAAIVLAQILFNAAALNRELKRANQILAEGGALFLFAKSVLEEHFPTKELIALSGPLTAEQKGRFLRYGKGRVLASHDLFFYGLLTPSSGCDRRMVLLVSSNSAHPRVDNLQLRSMIRDGWGLLPIVFRPLRKEHDELLYEEERWLLQGIPAALRAADSEKQQRDILQAWFLEREPERHSQVEERLGRLMSSLTKRVHDPLYANDQCYFSCIMDICDRLIRAYDEVNCFYLMMKAAEYIICCRALLSRRCQEGMDPIPFDDSPSSGTLAEYQQDWNCGSHWIGERGRGRGAQSRRCGSAESVQQSGPKNQGLETLWARLSAVVYHSEPLYRPRNARLPGKPGSSRGHGGGNRAHGSGFL